jgi:NADH-quinone oxidoreductase subunit L
LIFGPFGGFEHHLAQTSQLHSLEIVTEASHVEPVVHLTDWGSILIGTFAALLGLGFSYVFYHQTSEWPARLSTRFRPIYQASYHKFYIDDLYDRAIVVPTRFLGQAADFLDSFVVSNLVQAVAWAPRFVGRTLFGPRQNGLVQYYAAWTAMSLAILLIFLFFSY